MSTENPCVLIVDDNAGDIARVERALSGLNCRFVTLQDPHQVLKYVEAEKPDLVILDALLPGVSGFDLCKRIKTAPNGLATRVLILTGVYLKEQYRNEAMTQFKADDFVTKPFRPPELQRLASKLLGASKGSRGRYARVARGGWLGRLWGRLREPPVEGIHLEAPEGKTSGAPSPASAASPRSVAGEKPEEAPVPTASEREPVDEPPSRSESPDAPRGDRAPSTKASEDERARLDLGDLPRFDLLAEKPEEPERAPRETESTEEQEELKRRADHVSRVLRGMTDDPAAIEHWEGSETERTIPGFVSPFYQKKPKFIDERKPLEPAVPEDATGTAAPVEPASAEESQAEGAAEVSEAPLPKSEGPAAPAERATDASSRSDEASAGEGGGETGASAAVPAEREEAPVLGGEKKIEAPLPTSRLSKPEATFREVPIYEEGDFLHELRRELSKCRRVSKPLTLILLSIADMAQIIELFGKDFRRQVLWYVAEQAADALREVDFAGFLASHQLIALTAFASDRYGGTRIVGRIKKALGGSPFTVGEGIPSMVPALSFGMATFPDDGGDVDALLERARREMNA